MAAIASTQVSLYPTDIGSSESYPEGKGKRGIIERRLKITAVTAADTATAAVLGLKEILSAHSGYNASSPGAVALGVDPVNSVLQIGSGPSNATIYLTVTGTSPVA